MNSQAGHSYNFLYVYTPLSMRYCNANHHLVVSNIFYFHPENWGNDPILTHIFQMGWFNHQLDIVFIQQKKPLGPMNPTPLLVHMLHYGHFPRWDPKPWMKTEGSMGFAGGIAPPQTTILEIQRSFSRFQKWDFPFHQPFLLRIQARVPMPITTLEFYSRTPFYLGYTVPGFLQMGPTGDCGRTLPIDHV